MTNVDSTRVSLSRLARALDRYNGKYEAFEVFADDVDELHRLRRGESLPVELQATARGTELAFVVEGKPYVLTLADGSATARITRGPCPSAGSDFSVLVEHVGNAIGLAASSKGEGWIPGLIMGVLAGSPSREPQKERTLTVQYDAKAQQWRAFGGPMSQWLRQQHAASG